MIDTHTHLDSCEPPNAELVARAEKAGLARMLTVGLGVESSRSALAAAETFPSVYAAVGLHPNSAGDLDDAALDELRALAAHPRCVAIGETGLDFFRAGASADDQARAFSAQIGLARETGKPLVIHTRAADDETLLQLDAEARGLRVLLHCFSMPDRLDECLERGYLISFAGNVTYPKNGELRAAAARVPANRLLVETDAPYLSPQPVRKQRNEPANVVHTARAIAAERGESYEELAATMTRNAAALFGW
jgi:TatD DNase family protein